MQSILRSFVCWTPSRHLISWWYKVHILQRYKSLERNPRSGKPWVSFLRTYMIEKFISVLFILLVYYITETIWISGLLLSLWFIFFNFLHLFDGHETRKAHKILLLLSCNTCKHVSFVALNYYIINTFLSVFTKTTFAFFLSLM